MARNSSRVNSADTRNDPNTSNLFNPHPTSYHPASISSDTFHPNHEPLSHSPLAETGESYDRINDYTIVNDETIVIPEPYVTSPTLKTTGYPIKVILVKSNYDPTPESTEYLPRRCNDRFSGQHYRKRCSRSGCDLGCCHGGRHIIGSQVAIPSSQRDRCLEIEQQRPYSTVKFCGMDGCKSAEGHTEPHLGADSRKTAARLYATTRAIAKESLAQLTILVMSTMATKTISPNLSQPVMQCLQSLKSTRNRQRTAKAVASCQNHPAKTPPSAYSTLNLSNREIRLFQLSPAARPYKVKGSFTTAKLSECPDYIALSYTWGDQTIKHDIELSQNQAVSVNENAWNFLRLQSQTITQPTWYWIDSICINQEDVHERNHQVGLMKLIYANATDVFVWLGKEADDSACAMEFISQQSSRPLRKRGSGYYPVWNRQTGNALHTLCERPYWSRVWIIQELLYANRITVWCGIHSFDWKDIEALYLKLKTIEDTHWFTHHNFHIAIKESPAVTMVWQRAHWRHPDTPTPSLRCLIDIFCYWKCSDIRDKVFALVGMATSESAIMPDYGLSSREVYFAVMRRAGDDRGKLANLLSQIFGLSRDDVNLWEQNLLEYECSHPRI